MKKAINQVEANGDSSAWDAALENVEFFTDIGDTLEGTYLGIRQNGTFHDGKPRYMMGFVEPDGTAVSVNATPSMSILMKDVPVGQQCSLEFCDTEDVAPGYSPRKLFCYRETTLNFE